jgi:hypothetical protein
MRVRRIRDCWVSKGGETAVFWDVAAWKKVKKRKKRP